MERGLYEKYIVLDANTGEQTKGFCFVLKPHSDKAARVALEAYIEATTNWQLARDLEAMLKDI